jgi:hypothetical protein
VWMRLVGAAVLLAVAGCSALPGTQHGSEEPVGADCGGGPLPTSSAPHTPESRAAQEHVEAFISDYYRAWERAGKPGSTFEAWNAERATLATTYMVDEGAFALDEGGLGWPANHDPEQEEIRSVSVAGDLAWVRSRVSRSPEHFYTYLLTRVGDQWRIERTTLTLDPPTAPVLSPRAHAALLDGVPAESKLQGDPERAPSELDDLFASPFRVERLGPMTTSGVMAVHDFGWVDVDLAPLSQRVPAGTYPVFVSHRADGVNMALRVQFADKPAARWVNAARVGSDNQVIVDAGNVVVLDFATMPLCRNEWIEELYQDHLMATEGDVFSIAGGPDDAVMVQAGYGDGVYPVYWGVATDGTITDLLVDFLVD